MIIKGRFGVFFREKKHITSPHMLFLHICICVHIYSTHARASKSALFESGKKRALTIYGFTLVLLQSHFTKLLTIENLEVEWYTNTSVYGCFQNRGGFPQQPWPWVFLLNMISILGWRLGVPLFLETPIY